MGYEEYDCMNCGQCNDCIMRTMEAHYEAEIEQLKERLASLEAAADEVLSEANQRGNRVTWEMVNAIKRLRAVRGQQTGG